MDIFDIIANRRTTKAANMNGKLIDKDTVTKILAAADWAPTHGRTEPWRFNVYTGQSLMQFCYDHAEMYLHSVEDEASYDENKYNNLLKPASYASHLVVVYMKRTEPTKIPAQEEYAATAAAIQNMLLAATAIGVASIWNTGGMIFTDAMKEYLGLADADQVLGFIYLGYTDQEAKEGMRKIPLENKITWK